MTRLLNFARRFALALPLLAASCAGEPPPESFTAPTYSYLTPIRLNVASVEIQDRSIPEQGSVDTLAPVRATESLKQMAKDRLVASGSAGRAVFVIERASIVRADGGLSGTMAVHLDVYAGGDARAGFAEAKVTRSRTSTDTSENTGRVLYEFNRQMMADMNVEFEFQVTHALKDWVQVTAGVAPPPPPVQSQDLPPPS
jgi:hypothetical protein